MNLEKNNSKKLNELRNTLNKKLSTVSKIEEKKENNIKSINENDIKPGIIVFVPSFNKNGTILSFPNQSKKVNIQIDNIKTTLPISSLSLAKKIDEPKEIYTKKQLNFSPKK